MNLLRRRTLDRKRWFRILVAEPRPRREPRPTRAPRRTA